MYTGVALYAIEDHAGPLAAWFATESAASAPATAEDEDQDEAKGANETEDPREEFWEELHDFFADFTLALVILHIAGGLFSSYLYKENLIFAMFTGRKRP